MADIRVERALFFELGRISSLGIGSKDVRQCTKACFWPFDVGPIPPLTLRVSDLGSNIYPTTWLHLQRTLQKSHFSGISAKCMEMLVEHVCFALGNAGDAIVFFSRDFKNFNRFRTIKVYC